MIVIHSPAPADLATMALTGAEGDHLRKATVAAIKSRIQFKQGDPTGFIALYGAITRAFAASPEPHSPIELFADPQAVIEAVRFGIRQGGGLASGPDLTVAAVAMNAGAKG